MRLKLRSFTAAGAEVFGAGHNALGAWLWLDYQGELGALERPTTFHQEVGQIVLPITLEWLGGQLHGRMKQAPLRLVPPLTLPETLATALGLRRADILDDP